MKRFISILLVCVLMVCATPVHAARTGESSSSFTVAAGTAMAVSKGKTYRSITVQPDATLTVGLNGALTIQEELTVNGNLIVIGTLSVKKLTVNPGATVVFIGSSASAVVTQAVTINTEMVYTLYGAAAKPIKATGTVSAPASVRGVIAG